MVRRPIGTHSVRINRGAAIHAGERLDDIDLVLAECAEDTSPDPATCVDGRSPEVVEQDHMEATNPLYGHLGNQAVQKAMNDVEGPGVTSL